MWVELTSWHRALYARPWIGGDDPGQSFDEHARRAAVWVAERRGEVVGFAALDGDELEPVVVTAAHRSGGIGRALVAAVLAEAERRGLDRVRVRPVARNDAAIAFFRACGFDVLARVELQRDVSPLEWRQTVTVDSVAFRA